MGDRGIPTHAVTYEWSHPAWTPQDVTGTPVAGASAGDSQAFDAKGVALKLSGGLGFKEERSQRTDLNADDGQRQEPSGYRTADDIFVAYTVPNAGPGKYLPGYLSTVKNDADRRAGRLVVTWATGNTTTIDFYVESDMPVPVPGGAVTGAATLYHDAPPAEVRGSGRGGRPGTRRANEPTPRAKSGRLACEQAPRRAHTGALMIP